MLGAPSTHPRHRYGEMVVNRGNVAKRREGIARAAITQTVVSQDLEGRDCFCVETGRSSAHGNLPVESYVAPNVANGLGFESESAHSAPSCPFNRPPS